MGVVEKRCKWIQQRFAFWPFYFLECKGRNPTVLRLTAALMPTPQEVCVPGLKDGHPETTGGVFHLGRSVLLMNWNPLHCMNNLILTITMVVHCTPANAAKVVGTQGLAGKRGVSALIHLLQTLTGVIGTSMCVGWKEIALREKVENVTVVVG